MLFFTMVVKGLNLNEPVTFTRCTLAPLLDKCPTFHPRNTYRASYRQSRKSSASRPVHSKNFVYTIQGRRNRGGYRGQGPPIFCALALAAASHACTTRNAKGDLYLRRHNCPKCPQNAPKNCLKSQFYGGHAPRYP